MEKFLADYTSLGPKLPEGMGVEVVDDSGSPDRPAPGTNPVKGLYQAVQKVFMSAMEKPVLPRHFQDTGNKQSGSACDRARVPSMDSSGAVHHFLAVCVPFMRHGVKAHQPDVCDVLSDYEFFSKLTRTYSSTRKGERWSFMRKVRRIEFVKVSKLIICRILGPNLLGPRLSPLN